jgi:hypothetical protein
MWIYISPCVLAISIQNSIPCEVCFIRQQHLAEESWRCYNLLQYPFAKAFQCSKSSSSYRAWTFFFYLVCEAIGTAATPGLLCQPRVIVKIVESRWNVDWQEKPKFSEKTCPSATFVHHKPHMPRSGFEPRTATVGSRRLTAWAMARPSTCLRPLGYRDRFSPGMSEYNSMYKWNLVLHVPF